MAGQDQPVLVMRGERRGSRHKAAMRRDSYVSAWLASYPASDNSCPTSSPVSIIPALAVNPCTIPFGRQSMHRPASAICNCQGRRCFVRVCSPNGIPDSPVGAQARRRFREMRERRAEPPQRRRGLSRCGVAED